MIMNFFHASVAGIAAAFLTACVTPQQTTSKTRIIKPDEAFSFIRERTSQMAAPYQEPIDRSYTQPANKSEPCKLPTTQDQLNRSNFRAFWDGQCKNGFAYGLGRDIAISDTHHIEEITIYGDEGKNINAPSVTYDFVHNGISYKFNGSKYPEHSFLHEKVNNENGNFSIQYRLGVIDQSGNGSIIDWSPLSPLVTYIYYINDVAYRYSESQLAATINPSAPAHYFDTVDKKTGAAGGFAIALYANGQARHFKSGSNPPEAVSLPHEYLSDVSSRRQEILDAQKKATLDIQRAKHMEKEYLYLACNGKHKIQGLDKNSANAICTWRDRFQEPLKAALARYNEQLEKLKADASSRESKQKIQEQIDYQKRMTKAAERQAAAAETANTQNLINQYRPKTCYTNFGITTCY